MSSGKGPPVRLNAEPVGGGIPAGQDRRRRRWKTTDDPSLRLLSQARGLARLANALTPAAWAQLRKTLALKEVQPWA
jgi:hypothetical protein